MCAGMHRWEVFMKILIADDEDYTREGLIDSINWNSMGIRELMQARNGMEALAVAKWFKPDIVLTDIRMPKLNGIQFATELVQLNPQSKIIFMSGYMEIDYLKSAIQLAAVDYLEKPIDLAVLRSAIEKAAEDIKTKQQTSMLKADRKELQQQKLANTLICKDNDKEMLYKLCKEVAFPTDKNYICLIIWNKKGGINSEEFQNDILNFWKKCRLQVLCNYLGEGKYLVIIAFGRKESSKLTVLYRKMAESIPDITLGIGFDAADIMNIYNSYQTAQLAMNCAFYEEEERVFMIDEEILQKQGVEPGIYGEFMKVLTEEPFQLKNWCAAFFSDLRKQKYYRKEKIQTLLASFAASMAGQYPDLMDYISGVQSKEDLEQRMNRFLTLTEIEEFMNALIEKIESMQQNQSKYSRIIRGVMDYIANHYRESDLSITRIAEHFHFSPTYLNVLFKQETRVTLKQYLSDYRIEKAKTLLANEYYKISEISELCGYANGNYFAKVFKEVTDLTPLEYRKQRTE